MFPAVSSYASMYITSIFSLSNERSIADSVVFKCLKWSSEVGLREFLKCRIVLFGQNMLMFHFMYHFHLSPGAKLAHRASTCAFHQFLSFSAVRTSLQGCLPALDLSFSTVCHQVVFGWPLFPFPSGVHVTAVTQLLSGCHFMYGIVYFCQLLGLRSTRLQEIKGGIGVSVYLYIFRDDLENFPDSHNFPKIMKLKKTNINN